MSSSCGVPWSNWVRFCWMSPKPLSAFLRGFGRMQDGRASRILPIDNPPKTSAILLFILHLSNHSTFSRISLTHYKNPSFPRPCPLFTGLRLCTDSFIHSFRSITDPTLQPSPFIFEDHNQPKYNPCQFANRVDHGQLLSPSIAS